MKIDLSCPVELRRCQLPTPEYPVCEMIFFNLSDKPVSSIQVSFLCYDEYGEQTTRTLEKLPVKNAPPRQLFSMDAVIEEAVNVSGMEVAVKKVWFSDGTVWRSGTGTTSEFTPTPVLEENQLQVMKELAGEDALTYPSDQGAVWVCICGRPNAASEDTCRRCGRDKHDIFVNFNEAEIEKIIFQRESAAEEQERQEREQARKAKEEAEARAHARRTRRRTIIACTVSALVVLGLAFGYFYYLKPRNRYSTAMRWFDSGRYSDAKEVFRELNDADYFFGKYEKKFATSLRGTEGELDYARMIIECDYRAACDALEAGTNLEEVAKAFDALPEHAGSREKAMEARYLIAENKYNKALKEGTGAAYEEAFDACNKVGDPDYTPPADKEGQVHLSASQMILHGWYQQARGLENNKEYQAAYNIYTGEEYGLAGFNDSAVRAADCLHAMAELDMENGAYADAIDKYLQLPQYDDTARQLQTAYYNYADQLLSEGSFEEAAMYFDKAGKYLDAERRSKYECRYVPAVSIMNEGKAEKNGEKLADAAERFKELTNYEDSRLMYSECLCLIAELRLEAGEYEAALALLDETVDYRRSDELRFEIAKAYLENNGESEALEQFERIPDYVANAGDDVTDDPDSREESSLGYIRQICYGRALSGMENALACKEKKDYAAAEEGYREAAELFENLGDYLDSAEYALACRYNQALLCIDTQAYEDAVAILTEMPDYEDAPEKIRLATYRQAVALEESSDYEGALTIYRGLENYSDVRERRERCAVRLAEAEMAEGDLESAFIWLEGCTGADALELRNSMGFTLAEQMEKDGDLIGAAAKYASLGNYRGSKEKAAACREAYYGEAEKTVKDAMNSKDYLTVIETLDNLDMTGLGSEYASLKSTYSDACYRLANSLYADDRIYEAYSYYMLIQDYGDVKDKKLSRPCYLIFGKWEDSSGANTMEFRSDGTCYFLGKECFYRVQGQYNLKIGDNPDSLNQSYELVSGPSVKNKNLTLRKLPEKKPYYYMTRSAEEQ